MSNQSKNATIMIVDDNYINLSAQAYLMKTSGFDVIKVDHPGNVLDILSGQKIDGVLMDIEMPGMRGDELTVILHKKFPDLPIVAITSTQLSKLKVTKNAHFSAILQKPLTLDR